MQIFSNATATCNTTTAHHISPIVQIDENTILINDNNARIIENGSEMATNGTFLLIHSNDVHINGTLYPVTSRKPRMEPQTPSVFNLKNLQKIDQMTDQFEAKKKKKTSNWFAAAIFGFTMLTMTGSVCYCRYKRRENHEVIIPPVQFNNDERMQLILKTINSNLQQIRDESA
ncbi:uncharacterized protein LOC119647221 isoform X1 [Hermetia illucens]|uniref:uncharacterized protein LOC119647221 isoform X1 n=1 Tax=Hermetia illucens TaxID=343691 RepID=UPI0018CC58BF|nr:uncharacterized protein LOC119647221 isoform X1 [Hermetia illucens]XP_037903979.1 uncharacterized protein LOC119647221 isoform X1 [Hermetia illucens]